jgi:hypothetical protein
MKITIDFDLESTNAETWIEEACFNSDLHGLTDREVFYTKSILDGNTHYTITEEEAEPEENDDQYDNFSQSNGN